jgi:hypothetical protein
LQIVGICRAKPLKVDPLEVLEEGGKGIGPALRQLQKMRVRPNNSTALLFPVHLHTESSCRLGLAHQKWGYSAWQ